MQRQGSGYGPGFRAGAVFGIRVGERLSLNAELTLDRSNIDQSVLYKQQEWLFRGALSPLVHLSSGPLVFGVGPKIGLYSVSSDYTANAPTVAATDWGASTGINAGAFKVLSEQTSIGMLLSFDVMWSKSTCTATAATGYVTKCGPVTDVAKVLGMAAGLLF